MLGTWTFLWKNSEICGQTARNAFLHFSLLAFFPFVPSPPLQKSSSCSLITAHFALAHHFHFLPPLLERSLLPVPWICSLLQGPVDPLSDVGAVQKHFCSVVDIQLIVH